MPVDVDTATGAANVDKLDSDLDELDRKRVDAEADVDIAAGAKKLDELDKGLDELDRTRSAPVIDLDTFRAEKKQRDLSSDLDELDRKRVTAEVDVETATGTAKKHKLERNIDAVGRKRATAHVDVDTDRGTRRLLSFGGIWDRFIDKTRLDVIRSQLTLDKFASTFGRKIRLFVLAGIAAIVVALLALPPLAVLVAGAIVSAFGAAIGAIGIGFAATNDRVKKSFSDLGDHVVEVMKRISRPFISTLLAISGIAERTFDRMAPKLERSFELMAPHVTRFAGFFAAAFEELGRAFVPMTKAFNAILDVLGPILRDTFADITDELIDMARWVRRNKGEVGELVGFLLGLLPKAIHLVTMLAEHWRRERKAFIAAWDSQIVKDFGATFGPIVRDIADTIRKHWGPIKDWVRRNFGLVEDIIREVLQIIRVLWRHWGEDLMFIAERVFGGIAEAIEGNLRIIRGVFRIIGGLLRGDWRQVWAGIKDIALGALQIIRGAVRAVFGALTGIVRLAMHSVRDVVLGIWGQIRGGVRSALDAVRSAVRTGFGAVRDATRSAMEAVRDKVRDVLGAVRDAFRAAKEGIGKIWDGLKRIAAAPINFIINWVYTRGIKKIVDAIPGVGDLPEVNPIQTHRRGGYTGRGPRDKVAGLVHADEFVIRSEARERIERYNPGFLERLNKSGLPGHRRGGLVNPMARVYVDGEPLTAIHAAQLVIAGQLMGTRQHVIQGSWQAPSSYSGTSHTGPGVADTSPGSFSAQWAQRRSGIAAWARNIAGAAQAGSGAHVHGVSMFSAPGNSQLASYFAGGDGLGGRDYGPRPGVMPGIQERLKRFGALLLSTVGAGLGPGGLAIGRFSAPLGSIAGGVLGALDAIPDFLSKLADIKNKIDQMLSKGGWWPMLGRSMKSLIPAFKDWVLDELKSAGAWLKDEVFGLSTMGAPTVIDKARDAWNSVFDDGGTLYPGWNRVYNGTGRAEHLTPDSPPARRDGRPLRFVLDAGGGRQLTGWIEDVVDEHDSMAATAARMG